jgi:predicted TIM-barrel fold metal-dependent hydrolase
LVEAKGRFPWKNSDRTGGKDHPERIGALFRRAFAIWEREWADDRDRMIRVCSVQVGWPDAAKRTIRWCMDHGGADMVSPTAYFGPSKDHYRKWATAGADLTADMVIDDMFEGLSAQRQGGNLSEVVAFGRSLGLPYVAYEGGQHLQPEKQADLPYNPALAEAQMHPRMADLYLELIRIHRDLGCQMLAHFSSVGRQGTRWGSWGAKASYSQPDGDSPKMRTLLECNMARI